MSHDPWLDIFNTDVKTCESCHVAQAEMDEETGGGYVGWCEMHSAQFEAWASVQPCPQCGSPRDDPHRPDCIFSRFGNRAETLP